VVIETSEDRSKEWLYVEIHFLDGHALQITRSEIDKIQKAAGMLDDLEYARQLAEKITALTKGKTPLST
jgi:hypothetical protein